MIYIKDFKERYPAAHDAEEEKALGVDWDVKNDTLSVKVDVASLPRK